MVAQPPVQMNVNGSTPADKLSAALLKDDSRVSRQQPADACRSGSPVLS